MSKNKMWCKLKIESITPSFFIPSDTSFFPLCLNSKSADQNNVSNLDYHSQRNTYIGVECFTGWLCIQQHLSLNTADPRALFVFKHLLSKD